MTAPLSCGRETAPFRPCDGMTVLRTDTPTDRPLRHPSAARLGVGNDRYDNRRFLFSLVRYSLQQHFADFRRPERFDTESEDGYRFEVVNLYAAPISKLRSCRVPLYLPEPSGRQSRTVRRFPTRSWRLRLCRSAGRYCRIHLS